MTDQKLVEAGAQAIELCSLWTPRRLADAVLTATIPLIREAALEEAAKKIREALEPFATFPFNAGIATKLKDDTVLLNTGSAIPEYKQITVGNFRRAAEALALLLRLDAALSLEEQMQTIAMPEAGAMSEATARPWAAKKLLAREPTMAMKRAADERQGTGHPHIDIWCAMWDAAENSPSQAALLKEAREALEPFAGVWELIEKDESLNAFLQLKNEDFRNARTVHARLRSLEGGEG